MSDISKIKIGSTNYDIKDDLARTAVEPLINQWDEEWELGSFDNSGVKITSSLNKRNRNPVKVKPNTQYYIGLAVYRYYYDSNMGFLSMDSTESTLFTTPSDCAYVNIRQGTETWTDNVKFSINYPSSFTSYYPYASGSRAVWSEIAGKPSSFPPATHSHAWSEITSKPDSFPPATHSHAWSEITSKPDSFPPASHSHAWSEITGKPSSFTPSSHSHGASDITSGTLAVARGGTGKSAYASTNYTSVEYRGERFASSDTTPTDNGTICWTYE